MKTMAGIYFFAADLWTRIGGKQIFTPDEMEKLAKDFFVKGIKILFIMLIAKLTLSFGSIAIKRLLLPRNKTKYYIDEKRALTLVSLLRSTLRYSVYFIAIVMILKTLGLPVETIIAGAGIAGLAVGFGAQNLVRDIITGFFIILENQYTVGEYINVGSQLSGFVEELGIRVTKLRDWGGELHIIPNGQITQVTNYNRGSMRALVEVGIAYEEDIEEALRVLNQVGEEMARDFKDVIVEGPEVLGVVAFGPSEVVIRMIAQTKPMEQWAIERELRKRIKKAFDLAGIEIPYPRRVNIHLDDKTKKAYPLSAEPVHGPGGHEEGGGVKSYGEEV